MYVCCALSQDVDPGIDIEMCVGENDSPQLKKLQHWTAIEATLKAAGQGLRHARDVELAADRTSALFRVCTICCSRWRWAQRLSAR